MRLRPLVVAGLLSAGALACQDATAPAPGSPANLALLLPKEVPYITGTVVGRDNQNGQNPSVLLATNPGNPPPDLSGESGDWSAHVRLGAEVVVVGRDGRYASVDDLQPGRVVTVWIGPIVKKSLPPKVSGRVVVLER